MSTKTTTEYSTTRDLFVAACERAIAYYYDQQMVCPECYGDSFRIDATVPVYVDGAGAVSDCGEFAWDEEGVAECTSCPWDGLVADLSSFAGRCQSWADDELRIGDPANYSPLLAQFLDE
jgi:hypothetical protein